MARSCSSDMPSGRPKATACTPHSYSHPHRAHVRWSSDLAVERLDAPEVQDVRADRAEALQDRVVVRDGAEEIQRLDAGRHHAPQRLGDLGRVGGLERADAGLARSMLIDDLLYASEIEARRYHFGNRSASPARPAVTYSQTGPRRARSRTGRPIMAALDLLGRRWTLRVLWELRDGSAASFRELRERCDKMSTSVLNQRLAELREAGLVDAGAGGYSSQNEARSCKRRWRPWTRGRSAGARPAGGGVSEELRRRALSDPSPGGAAQPETSR